MLEIEMELIAVVRENDNPEQAVLTATEIILSFLAQLESSQ